MPQDTERRGFFIFVEQQTCSDNNAASPRYRRFNCGATVIENHCSEDGASRREIKNVWKKTVIAFTNKVRDAIDERKQSHWSIASSPPGGSDLVTKLERLTSLLEKGFLTKEEFAQQKTRLLA